MTATEVLFGFDGRISRGLFNTAMAAAILIAAVDWVVVVQIGPRILPVGIYPMVVVFGAVFPALILFMVVCALATKRLHDLGRSGWSFAAFVLVPLAGLAVNGAAWQSSTAHYVLLAIAAWRLSDMIASPGAVGSNRYGRDPLTGIVDYRFEAEPG